jgi:hypothetical protein
MEGSGLLQTLASQGGDPYGVGPFQPGQGFQGMGTGDPNWGVEPMLQLLAISRMGVGGGPGTGPSGLDLGSCATSVKWSGF